MNYTAIELEGGACAFCKRRFMTGHGDVYYHLRLTLCEECWMLLRRKATGFYFPKVQTAQNISVWEENKERTIALMEEEFGKDFEKIKKQRKIGYSDFG